jgi:hypothetical protein
VATKRQEILELTLVLGKFFRARRTDPDIVLKVCLHLLSIIISTASLPEQDEELRDCGRYLRHHLTLLNEAHAKADSGENDGD